MNKGVAYEARAVAGGDGWRCSFWTLAREAVSRGAAQPLGDFRNGDGFWAFFMAASRRALPYLLIYSIFAFSLHQVM